jgi:hypothetical protein
VGATFLPRIRKLKLRQVKPLAKVMKWVGFLDVLCLKWKPKSEPVANI